MKKRKKRSRGGRNGLEPVAWKSAWKVALLAVVVSTVILSACATVEATGERYLPLISEQEEIRLGRESDRQIQQTIGLYPEEGLQEYVDALGQRIASTTERPDLPWTFRVLDDPVVNAFALPGGYIYVTRGIMTHFENEAQLAGVLGHEIGHVTAKHSVIRIGRRQLAQLGVGVVAIAAPELEPFIPLAGLGLELLFLSYSRDDERQSDRLGVRYMTRIGEDPRELIDVMEMLDSVTQGHAAGAMPVWLSTHPTPANRKQIIADRIAELEADQRTFEPVERESYLGRLDGIVYGPNPREGSSSGGVFFHPELRFRYSFPSGWAIINRKQSVVATPSSREAVIGISLSEQGSPAAAAQAFYGQRGISGGGAQPTRINGLRAASGIFTARTEQEVLEGRVTFLAYDGRIYQVIGYSTESAWPRYAGAVRRSMESFNELTDSDALSVEPLRVRIVRVSEAVSLRGYYERNPMPIPLEELAQINQLDADDALQPGRLLKIVAGERVGER